MRKRLLFGSGVLLLAVLVTLVVWQGSFNFGSFAPVNIQQTYLFWAVSTQLAAFHHLNDWRFSPILCNGRPTTRYFKMSRLRLMSFSKSEMRMAFSRTRRSIVAVEQLPVCNRITLGGAPQVMLRLA
jgi:hypothetical protein